MTTHLKRSVTSLHVPNYRRYFTGQVISLSGNWMQVVAETWLVLKLTGSGLAVGAAAALQFAPMLLMGAWGGLLADRLEKRRLLTFTQAAMALPALALFTLNTTGVVAVWMVFALIFARGSVNAVDNPARQSFVIEMVGSDRVVNAVSLNSVIVQTARVVGPALAGGAIALVGVGPCFLINAASFGAMLVALRRMDPAALEQPDPQPRAPHAVRAGLAYVRRTPQLAIPLVLMAVVGTLAYNFQVLLPLLARFTFHGGPSTYAALVSALGAGSVVGALASGARGRTGPGLMVGASAALGVLILAAAAAPTLVLALAALVPLGAATVVFSAGVNSSLQLAVDSAMRGRVMALYSMVFLGSTAIGGPLSGWISQTVSPRAGLALGGIAAVLAAVAAARAFQRAALMPTRRGAQPSLAT